MIVHRPSSRNLNPLSKFSYICRSFDFFHTSSVLVSSETGVATSDSSHSQNAKNLLDEIQQRDVSYYIHLLFEYSRGGQNQEALKTYASMNRAGVSVDGSSLSCILKASTSLQNYGFGRQIHCQCVKNGFFEDVSVATALVGMHAKIGDLDDGKRVFDEIRVKNVVTWTSLLTVYALKRMTKKAVEVLSLMKSEGLEPNPFTYATVLGALAGEGAVEVGVQLHGATVKDGFDSTREVANALVSLYSKSGMAREAIHVFDGTECKDVVSWNGMIAGLMMNGFELDALKLFYSMRLAGIKFTEVTTATVLKLCANLKELGFARQIHCQVIKIGFGRFDNIRTTLMVCYSKGRQTDDAMKMFSLSDKVRNVVSWTAIIGGYLSNGRTSEAIDLFLLMRREGVRPNDYTYSTVLAALPTNSLFQMHAEVIKTNYENSSSVGTALLNTYIKLGKTDDAAKVFKQIEEKDIVAWSAMLVAYAQDDNTEGAVAFFGQLAKELRPNEFTFSTIINACATQSAATEQGKQFHASSIKYCYSNTLVVSSALVTMYAKKGDIESANEVFKRQQERDSVSWNSMIWGYAQHGYGEKALSVFKEMKERNLEMDVITFIGVISACTHAGLVSEGEAYFNMMVNNHKISPTMQIYSCMVDMYSRAGYFDKAMSLIDGMPFPAGATVWRALLAGCRVHRDLELGKYAAEKLISCRPQESAAYVLLTNLYAASGNWQERTKVRLLMDERKVKKEAGYSWIEVKNKTYSFVAGDVSHPLSDKIYKKLEELTIRLGDAGYHADTTNHVIHDIEEEEKEAILSRHSERLAIAFGLISLPHNIPIRIIKNLRVCGECHTVIKLISQIEGRKIVVRDSNRFHHFSKGLCSCGDYW